MPFGINITFCEYILYITVDVEYYLKKLNYNIYFLYTVIV